MKKLLIIPAMFLYLIAVSGILIQLHYCGQELDSWNVYVENEGCTDGDCGDESEPEHSCCDDKVIAAKLSSAQNTVKVFKLKQYELYALPSTIPQIWQPAEVSITVADQAINFLANAPPGLWQQIPLFKLHSSFTYYG